jgi:hypothetical protein
MRCCRASERRMGSDRDVWSEWGSVPEQGAIDSVWAWFAPRRDAEGTQLLPWLPPLWSKRRARLKGGFSGESLAYPLIRALGRFAPCDSGCACD